MAEEALHEEPDYDKVTQASMNSLYVKAQELDRDHNVKAAPSSLPPGALADRQTHATSHASDAQSHASDASNEGSRVGAQAIDVQSHASTHASDAESHASDGSAG